MTSTPREFFRSSLQLMQANYGGTSTDFSVRQRQLMMEMFVQCAFEVRSKLFSLTGYSCLSLIENIGIIVPFCYIDAFFENMRILNIKML